MTHNLHTHYMRYALRLAHRHLGLTAPNPTVGCVLVRDGHVVGVGITAIGGRPHAEKIALEMAGDSARGATAYVTLEPCVHVGQTPSCASEMVKSGIVKCYIATLDMDTRTTGQGVKILQDAGIETHVGVLQSEARYHHLGFFNVMQHARPMITVKIASSMDGKIALSNGLSKWITNEKSRAYGHYLRSTHDAILVGGNTVRSDRPRLDCRLLGMEHTNPVRIVLSRHLSANDISGDTKTLVLQGSIPDVLKQIAEAGINRVLVEGGGHTITQFFQQGCVDQIAHFQAPKIMGNDSTAVIGGLNIMDMIDIPEYTVLDTKRFENDIFTLYGRKI